MKTKQARGPNPLGTKGLRGGGQWASHHFPRSVGVLGEMGGTVEAWEGKAGLWRQSVYYGLKVKRSDHGSPGECGVDS